MLNEQQKKNNINIKPFIEVRSVSFSYNGKDENAGRTLQNVSFFVNKGERIAILGHNGSGKSTLVKILGGIFFPDEGEYFIDGVEINEIDFHSLRKKIGMVFQDPENQIVAAMVEDDVAFAPENQGLPSDEIQNRVDIALNETNMLHKRDASVSALSGGEKQRIALAGALAADVQCLILDEPTAMLDPKGRLTVEKVLRRLHHDGMTMIQVTHQINAENFDDIQRVIVLSKGKIKWTGTTHEFWDMSESLGFNLPDEFKIRRYCRDHDIHFPFCPSFTSVSPLCQQVDISPQEGRLVTCSNTNSLSTCGEGDRETVEGSPNIKFKIENLSFKYEENHYALKNINAEFFNGQWLSIIGRTGSGKSTLVQHLNALFKIQEGKIFFDGENLPQKGEGLQTLRQRVGLVFQHPEDQLFSSTVKEELAFAPKNAGFKNSELDEAVLYGLECAGLDKDFLNRSPIALSGGERRLVAIASVMSAKPECVILDEPLAGLDASYQNKILTMLGTLRDKGKTIITITHDLDMALNYSDRILILRNSEQIELGKPGEILEELMEVLEPESWPDVLRISNEIRKINQDFPLLYNYQDFISCISQI
ncbi:MAG: ATP-binding cassette domain-containing protein [Synergistaceae bacterium]|nr:ATP-binding cassette domain-containing protein [Synergistaceae bacterium]